MTDSSRQLERVALTEVSDDDEDVVLVAAALDDDPAQEVDLVLPKDSGPQSEAQINGVMVLTLLDKIIGVVDQIQQTQNGLEARQQDMEKSVSGIQSELSKLSKNHTGTANTVNKMLDKVRKVSVNVKTVRTNLEKQAGQIKKLESNENELLKRRNFKVLIYQDEMKTPKGSKSTKASEKVLEGVAEEGGEAVEDREGAHIGLHSDEEVEIEEIIEESRAERIKRTSKQRVDNIKKAFSKEKMEKTKLKTKENLEKTKQRTRENLEKTRQKTRENLEKTKHSLGKKMGKLSTRMTPTQERKEKMNSSKEKVMKSLTPDHTVYARSKTAVYRVPPFTFHVKKIRDGEQEVVHSKDMVEVAEDGDLEEEDALEGDELGLHVEVEEGELVNIDSPEMEALLEAAEDSQLVMVERSLPRKTSSK